MEMKMKTTKLGKIKSLGELRQLASADPRYLQLAIIAVENLGGSVTCQKENMKPGDVAYAMSLDKAMHILNMNANETNSERGVVAEVNFVRDLVR
jgi:hypothetical protein